MGWNPETHNGHAYVDLGLRSGGNKILFATTNIGANSPEEVGDFFAWGETSKRYSTLIYASGIEDYTNPFDIEYSPFFYEENFYTGLCSYDEWGDVEEEQCVNYYNKYTGRGYYFSPNEEWRTGDGKNTLELSDDVAHVLWGGNWRMPDLSDLNLLYSELSTDYTDNWNSTGKAGVVFSGIGAFYGNSIFLPITGYIENDVHTDYEFIGAYWSRTVCDDEYNQPDSAWALLFEALSELHETPWTDFQKRYIGLPVRPVLVLPE